MSLPGTVLHVIAPAPFGGAETVVRALATGLRERGVTISVLAAVNTPAHPFVAALRNAGFEPAISSGGRMKQIRAIRALKRDGRARIVHSHGYRSDVLARLANRDGGSALISTVHGFTGGGLRNLFYERLQRGVLRGFDAVVAVSGPLKSDLVGHGVAPERVHLIPNALPPGSVLPREIAREHLGLPASASVIGWVGRLSEEKGPDLALEALNALERIDWIAAFIGSGPLERELRARALDSPIASRVRWLETQPNAGELMAAFDVLMCSSRTEGTPMVLLEAMAAGVPIVATAVGGIPDLLEHGVRGRLVPPGEPRALARALEEILGSSHRIETAIGGASAMYSEWLSKYESVYREVL